MRPFYTIAHHCNTEKEVNEAVERDGANAIECDITPIFSSNNELKFKIYHAWDFFRGRLFIRYTPLNKVDSYFKNLKRLLDNGKLALIMLDCKEKRGVDPEHYAKKLVALLRKHGIDEKFCLIGVSGKEQSIHRFYQGLAKYNFNAAKDAYESSYTKNNLNHWIQFAKRVGASFLGLGIDSKAFFSPLFRWIPWIKRATEERDQQHSGAPNKVLFWTLNTKRAMRKTLNCGVDGIITNFPRRLNEVLKERAYSQTFRLATQKDSVYEKYSAVAECKKSETLTLDSQKVESPTFTQPNALLDLPCCLSASNRQIPAATETFKLPTSPRMGIANKPSQSSFVRRLNPLSSEPNIRPIGPDKSISYSNFGAAPSSP